MQLKFGLILKDQTRSPDGNNRLGLSLVVWTSYSVEFTVCLRVGEVQYNVIVIEQVEWDSKPVRLKL